MEEKKQQLKFPGFPEKPEENYWQYPKICNGWWHLLSGAEQKVLDYLLRHTWGYQKYQGDYISLKQFAEGIINKKTGEIVDRGTGLSKPEVISSLQELEKKGFVERIGDKKTGKVNYYKLKLQPVKKVNTPSKESLQVTSKESLHTINNVTINNKTIVVAEQSSAGKEINNLIELFKPINPTYDRLFGNKTQRASLDRLVKKFGREKVENMIKTLPKIFGKPYAPVITTPYLLEQKLSNLIVYLKAEKEKIGKIWKL